MANAVEQCLNEDPAGCVAVYWAKTGSPPALSPAEIARAWHTALSRLPAEEHDFIWAVVDLSQPGTFQVKELRWGIAYKRRRCNEFPPSREPGPLVLHFCERLPSSPEESTRTLKYLMTCHEQYMTCAQALQREPCFAGLHETSFPVLARTRAFPLHKKPQVTTYKAGQPALCLEGP